MALVFIVMFCKPGFQFPFIMLRKHVKFNNVLFGFFLFRRNEILLRAMAILNFKIVEFQKRKEK